VSLASRCAVFGETDLIHKRQIGVIRRLTTVRAALDMGGDFLPAMRAIVNHELLTSRKWQVSFMETSVNSPSSASKTLMAQVSCLIRQKRSLLKPEGKMQCGFDRPQLFLG